MTTLRARWYGLCPQQRLRRDLAFAVSDWNPFWIDAPAQALEATSDYNSCIAKELLAREIIPGESPVGQQAHELDLDRSPARTAISKEL